MPTKLSECLRVLRGNTTTNRLYFSLCCFFSLVIVGITLYFFYSPEGLGLSSEIYSNLENQPGTRELRFGGGNEGHFLDAEESGTLTLNVKDFKVVENGNKFPTRIRHQSHRRHNHGKLPSSSSSSPSLEELKQKSFMSNVIENRILHLDLKGAPMKILYLKAYLTLAKKAGINGLLIEWEDTYPWAKSLENISLAEGEGYSMEEVEEIVNFAEMELDFEVIPLIQTFGHVEFILKGEKFRHLREVDQDPQAFCPSKKETFEVIKEMIDQILAVHKNSRFIHIGCDEVYHLRVCSDCRKATEFKEDLFLNHVLQVATYVKQKGKIPLIWDDMLRVISLRRLNESGIGSIVEPMVWVYAEDVDRFVGWENFQKYAEIFPTVWGAAAFKGAYGETLSIPPFSRHAENTNRWISVITRESSKWALGTGGLVLTGWIRYDHFSVFCELFPAAIPSLIYNSLQLSIPANAAMLIKNRIFVSPNQEIDYTHPTTAISVMISASTSSDNNLNTSSSPITLVEESSSREEIQPSPSSHISKRSPSSYIRNIAHPRILMTKDRLARLALQPGDRSPATIRESSTPVVYDKFDHVNREFCQLLACPNNHHTRIDLLLKSDPELNFATRCNFEGVAFFRLLFRLKPILEEGWELIDKIQRKRGWITPYNIRHNYSLPLRVDEVVFSEVPKIRRQLEMIVKGIETSLKPIFRQQIILEWIEQNVYDIWKKLKHLESVGETLKNVNVWPRRPIHSPNDMIENFKLSKTDQEEL